MPEIRIWIIAGLILAIRIYSQGQILVSGYIVSQASGEPLAFASIQLKNSHSGSSSNGFGYYSISVPVDSCALQFSYIGYETFTLDVYASSDSIIKILLKPVELNLNEVSIEATRLDQSNSLEVLELTMTDIRKLPLVFGEVDIIKGIQLQSGIKTIGEGAGALFVRGGNSDQNLILMDEMPLYNTSHLFGFVSIFNPDAISSVKVYKGISPPQYGGRLSSVVDIRQKYGNLYSPQYTAGASIFAARAGTEGPVKKGKSSYVFNIRKSLIDIMIEPNDNYAFIPGFYDINAKYRINISSEDQLQFGVYQGSDKVISNDGLSNIWGNTAFNLKYQRSFSAKLFGSFSSVFSAYHNDLTIRDSTRNYKWRTGIVDYTIKSDWEWNPLAKVKWSFGVQGTFHQFLPGRSGNIETSIANVNALETAIYSGGNFMVSDKLTLMLGLRWSGFTNVGAGTWFEREEFQIVERNNTKGAYNYKHNIEPRINLVWVQSEKSSFEFGIARNTQYVQMLQNNRLAYTSLETWFPSNPNIKPQSSNMMNLAWRSSHATSIQFSLSGYYKTIQNQIDYIDHAQLINNPFVLQEIRRGIGKAWGVEMVLEKMKGRWTGQLSYNWSRSISKIAGINENRSYSTLYDIPHDIRLTGIFKTVKRWGFSAFWIYSTGRPYTQPYGFVSIEGENIPLYGKRNGSRFPDYNRLDVAATLHPKIREKRLQGTLTLGIFNLYGRQNPLSYKFNFPNSPYLSPTVYQYNFLRFFPNVAYAVKF